MNVTGDPERESLEGKIHYEELVQAVKGMKNNKTHGSDGYPIEFFKFVWKDFGKMSYRQLMNPASTKNFQLCKERELSHVCLKLRKIESTLKIDA